MSFVGMNDAEERRDLVVGLLLLVRLSDYAKPHSGRDASASIAEHPVTKPQLLLSGGSSPTQRNILRTCPSCLCGTSSLIMALNSRCRHVSHLASRTFVGKHAATQGNKTYVRPLVLSFDALQLRTRIDAGNVQRNWSAVPSSRRPDLNICWQNGSCRRPEFRPASLA